MLEKVEIANRAAAAVFRSRRQRKILLTLIEKERSLKDLMEITGLPLNLLHYHIRKMIRLRLVEIASLRKRAGAPITLYRAKAKTFFVPAALGPQVPDNELSARLRAALENTLAGTIKGVEYSHGGKGPRMTLVRDAKHYGSVASYWLDLRLSDKDATVLAAELGALFDRFRKRSGTAGRSYVVHGAIAPFPKR